MHALAERCSSLIVHPFAYRALPFELQHACVRGDSGFIEVIPRAATLVKSAAEDTSTAETSAPPPGGQLHGKQEPGSASSSTEPKTTAQTAAAVTCTPTPEPVDKGLLAVAVPGA